MPEQLGPIEIICDTPPYPIIQASAARGIEWPEDVGWRRLSHHIGTPPSWWSLLKSRSWRTLLGSRQQGECVCGHPLPSLTRETLAVPVGQDVSYLLGQCERFLPLFSAEA